MSGYARKRKEKRPMREIMQVCTKSTYGRKEELGDSGKSSARTSLNGSQKVDVSMWVLGGNRRHSERD